MELKNQSERVPYKTIPVYHLGSNEAKALAVFVTNHDCGRDLSIEYSIAGGIGRNTVVRCSCGEAEADITDYGSW